MRNKSALIFFFLLITTVIGISLALVGQDRWMGLVFWYSSQLLPVIYVVLAWWGSRRADDSVETAMMSSLPPAEDSRPENHV